MIETLADLQRLRQQLQEAVATLMREAETDPESNAALGFTRLASACQKLEREIALLSNDLLTAEPPSGAA
jgi:HPt (histidine-containing phosphotransfer) domain-containing protein